MESPITGKEMKIVKEWREMTFRKEVFVVLFYFYHCDDTGEKFEDEHFSALNYNQVVDQYQVRHSRLAPE